MATTINEQKEIVLIDGTVINARPLKISLLRDFMKEFETLTTVADSNDKSMDVLLKCVVIALKQYKPELAEDPKALEELLDLPTVYKIVEEASGVQMSTAALIGAVN
jgi:hypothetical protein